MAAVEITVSQEGDDSPIVMTAYLPGARAAVRRANRATLPVRQPYDLIATLVQMDESRDRLDEFAQACFDLGRRYQDQKKRR